MTQEMSLQVIIEQVSREKGIDADILVETMEQAILTAAKKTFGATRDLEARFNPDTGNVDLYQYMTLVEEVDVPECEISVEDARRHGLEQEDEQLEVGEQLGFQIFYMPEDSDRAKEQDRQFGDLLKLQQSRRGFGRIAAQTAKQVIIQRVRDAERELIYNEYKSRKGELITGTVRRFERGSNIIVDLNQTEAILPSREQTPRESYRPGDRIVAFLKDIDREARGPQLILSRTDVGLLVKLFEMEVPEIYEGIVRIVAAAREPGARSKIAVTSRDSDVDPVGACVGMKGSRVQAVVQELRGEKIDIVPFDRDPARFVCNAIAPAEVSRVIIDEGHGSMELVVPDAKLSLAIGRRGQNVRLASQLTGWRLDIISETRFRQIEEQAIVTLSMMKSVDEGVAKAFYKMGFRSLDEVLEAPDEELMTIEGIDTAARVAEIRADAVVATEALREILLAEAKTRAEPLTEREHLTLARGVTEHVAETLERGGYRSVRDVMRESDVDRLSLRTGLGNQKAREIKAAIEDYVSNDMEAIKSAQRDARIAHEEAQRAEEGEGDDGEGALHEGAGAEGAAVESAAVESAAVESTAEDAN